MKIWIFNNYNMLPEQGGLNRHYYFAKELKARGHAPVVFVGSHPHNTNLQMIEGDCSYAVDNTHGFPWVYVKTCNYAGSKLKRLFSMFQYYRNAKKAAKSFQKPDAIIGSSAHPLAAVLAIMLGKKYHCKAIVEIRDLWPESIVAYGIAGKNNPAVLLLRRLEKWIYTKADALIFTMEGAYDYIIEQGWEKAVPREKVHYINNGVDLEQFEYNKEHYTVEDADLDDPETFKVVYTGSIRKVNNLGLLLDAAKNVTDHRIKILIWGDGDEKEALEKRVISENIGSVLFKGKVEKNYIPSIVSRANINIAHNEPSPLFRYGISFNKLFDYMAAGKPVLCDFPSKYNPVIETGAGIEVQKADALSIARVIEHLADLDDEQYAKMCDCAKAASEAYSFQRLTNSLLSVIRT